MEYVFRFGFGNHAYSLTRNESINFIIEKRTKGVNLDSIFYFCKFFVDMTGNILINSVKGPHCLDVKTRDRKEKTLGSLIDLCRRLCICILPFLKCDN